MSTEKKKKNHTKCFLSMTWSKSEGFISEDHELIHIFHKSRFGTKHMVVFYLNNGKLEKPSYFKQDIKA